MCRVIDGDRCVALRGTLTTAVAAAMWEREGSERQSWLEDELSPIDVLVEWRETEKNFRRILFALAILHTPYYLSLIK